MQTLNKFLKGLRTENIKKKGNTDNHKLESAA